LAPRRDSAELACLINAPAKNGGPEVAVRERSNEGENEAIAQSQLHLLKFYFFGLEGDLLIITALAQIRGPKPSHWPRMAMR
jgi:hypothetical protein